MENSQESKFSIYKCALIKTAFDPFKSLILWFFDLGWKTFFKILGVFLLASIVGFIPVLPELVIIGLFIADETYKDYDNKEKTVIIGTLVIYFLILYPVITKAVLDFSDVPHIDWKVIYAIGNLEAIGLSFIMPFFMISFYQIASGIIEYFERKFKENLKSCSGNEE